MPSSLTYLSSSSLLLNIHPPWLYGGGESTGSCARAGSRKVLGVERPTRRCAGVCPPSNALAVSRPYRDCFGDVTGVRGGLALGRYPDPRARPRRRSRPRIRDRILGSPGPRPDRRLG